MCRKLVYFGVLTAALGVILLARAYAPELGLATPSPDAWYGEIDPVIEQQFEAASDAVREAIAERQQERAAERQRAEAVAREQADRVAICREIETLAGDQAIDRIAELKVQWDRLPPMPSEYAASLTRRFQDARTSQSTPAGRSATNTS